MNKININLELALIRILEYNVNYLILVRDSYLEDLYTKIFSNMLDLIDYEEINNFIVNDYINFNQINLALIL